MNDAEQAWQLKDKIRDLLPYMELTNHPELNAVRNLFAHSIVHTRAGGIEIYPLRPERSDTQSNIKNLPIKPTRWQLQSEDYSEVGLGYSLDSLKQLYKWVIDTLLESEEIRQLQGPRDFTLVYLRQLKFYPDVNIPNGETFEGYVLNNPTKRKSIQKRKFSEKLRYRPRHVSRRKS